MIRSIYVTVVIVLISIPLSSQTNTQQLDREKEKVMIFTPEERANLQLWFYEQTQKMGLSEETNAEYERIFYDQI